MLLVEEGQRLAGLQCFQPQRHLGQFGGHRVDVDAVDAAADDSRSAAWTTASGGSASPVSSAATRLAMRRAAATRKWPEPQAGSQTVISSSAAIAFLGGRVRAGLVEERVERRVEQALDQRGRRVVGAGGLALVAGAASPGVGELLVVVAGDQLQQGLVDAAEFLGTEVAEVDPAAGAAAAGCHQDRARTAPSRPRWSAGRRRAARRGAGPGRRRRWTRRCRRGRAGQLGHAAFGAERVEDELGPPNRSPCRPPRWRRASRRSRAEEKYVA